MVERDKYPIEEEVWGLMESLMRNDDRFTEDDYLVLVGISNDAGDICDENAKLRELVRILYYCKLPWKECDKCAMNGADMHVRISDVEFCDGMYDRMRELGVEVTS